MTISDANVSESNATDAELRVIATQPVAGMLTVAELAALLRCSSRTVYRLADAGRLPAPCRLGGMVRWPATVIDAWMAAGCPMSARPGRHRNVPN